MTMLMSNLVVLSDRLKFNPDHLVTVERPESPRRDYRMLLFDCPVTSIGGLVNDCTMKIDDPAEIEALDNWIAWHSHEWLPKEEEK